MPEFRLPVLLAAAAQTPGQLLREAEAAYGTEGTLARRVQLATGDARPAVAFIKLAGRLHIAPPRTEGCDGLSFTASVASLASTNGSVVAPSRRRPWHPAPRAQRAPPPTPRRLEPLEAPPRSPGSAYTARPTPRGGGGGLACAWFTQQLRANAAARARFPSVRAYAAPTPPPEPEEAEEGERGEEGEEDEAAVSGTDCQELPSAGSPPAERALSAEAETVVVSIPWDDAELRAVFNKFGSGDDRELRTEDLCNALHYLGARPRQNDVDGIVSEMTSYSSFSFHEFAEFIRRYREQDVRELRGQFEAADRDGNGALDVDELHMLLLEAGYSPTGAVTREALREIDKDGDGMVEFEEFEQLREHLRKTRGFLKEEAAEFRTIFRRASRGEGNTMPTEDLPRIANYLGFSIDSEALEKIVRSIDKNSSGELNFDELLQLIRSIQDYELDKLCTLIVEHADKRAQKAVMNFLTGRGARFRAQPSQSQKPGSPMAPSRTLSRRFSDLGALPSWAPQRVQLQHFSAALPELGYFASEAVIQEILSTKFADREYAEELTLMEVFDFLRAYRLQEGFSQADLQELRAVFDSMQRASVAGNNDETLDSLELGCILRWFGVSKSLQQVRRLIDEFDFDGSRELEFNEFIKMMRRFWQQEAHVQRAMFDAYKDKETDTVRWEDVPELLLSITGSAADFATLLALKRENGLHSGDAMDRAAFAQFFKRYRQVLTACVRQNCGFVPCEVERLRATFNSYDTSNRGVLGDAEMRRVIEDHMPEAMMSWEGKEEMRAVLAQLPAAPDDLPGAPAPPPEAQEPCVSCASEGPAAGAPFASQGSAAAGEARTSSVSSEAQAQSSKSPHGRKTKGRRKAPRTINFNQFLALMRKSYDMRDERDIVREQEAINDCDYSTEEVEAFRLLFLSCVDSSGEMTLPMLLALLAKIEDFDDSAAAELADILEELSPEGRQVARFPQFLRLMKRITDDNFFGLNDSAQKILRMEPGRAPR